MHAVSQNMQFDKDVKSRMNLSEMKSLPMVLALQVLAYPESDIPCTGKTTVCRVQTTIVLGQRESGIAGSSNGNLINRDAA